MKGFDEHDSVQLRGRMRRAEGGGAVGGGSAAAAADSPREQRSGSKDGGEPTRVRADRRPGREPGRKANHGPESA